jgi:hypothetical protein
MMISSHDQAILREAGKCVAEICADPIHAENAELWKAHNRLERQRPLVTLYDWTRVETGDPFELQCQGQLAREIEEILRNRIYRWECLRDDQVWEPIVYCQMALTGADGYGMTRDVVTPDHAFGASEFRPVLGADVEPEDLLGQAVLTHDEAETARRYDAMCDTFDGILEVQKKGLWGTWSEPMDNFIQWRGIEQTLMDLIERPEWVHRWLGALVEYDIDRIQKAEQMGLLRLNNHDNFLITGGMLTTDELPASDFDGVHVRPKDLWGFSSTQIFSEVSPAMHEEFALQYESRFLSQFGLAYYGCCEPLHHKVDLIFKHLPNVRKISMSPWADVAIGAEAIGDRAVFCCKPNPAILGLPTWDVDAAREQLREALELTRGCVVEICMKDLHAVCGQPHRMTEWIAMAKQLAQDYA